MAKALNVVPLGGLGEFGMHIMAFCYDDSIIVVDCGLLFPEQELLGVDIIVPDVTFLLENREKVKAILLTHGHEDHIGALPFILPYLNVPIYGSPFTMALVHRKLEDHDELGGTTLHEIDAGDRVELGPFTVEFIAVTHSIVDSLALAIRTPVGLVIHTGDFKIDHSPIDGRQFDLPAFAAYGKEDVLALFSDSTNAERAGYTFRARGRGSIRCHFQGRQGSNRRHLLQFGDPPHPDHRGRRTPSRSHPGISRSPSKLEHRDRTAIGFTASTARARHPRERYSQAAAQ